MNRIAELRKAAGYSQAELAKMVGVAQNTLSQYENGLRRPSSRVTVRLADLFEVSPNYLLGESDDPNEVKSSICDLQLATRIVEEYDVNRVNLYLRKGWHLLHVGESRTNYDDGTYTACVVYTIGWFGEPNLAHELPSGWFAEDEEPYGVY